MSAPDDLYVRRNDDGSWTEVWIESRGGHALFYYLLPHLQRMDPYLGDQFAGEYYGEVLSITHIPAHHFPEVYRLIMQACDTLPELHAHKEALREALESDPRLQTA